MSLGAVQAGVQVALAVECSPHAAQTYAKNHQNAVVLCEDIRTLDARKLKKSIPGHKETIVFGGPPCQGFSYSNSRTRSPKNPDNWLFIHFLRVVRHLQPDWLVFENVRGVVSTAKGVFLTEIVSRIEELGYTVRYRVLNAQEFGVPQDRRRLFVVGARERARIKMPHSLRIRRTVRDAIADLPYLENGASISWMPYKERGSSAYARSLQRKLSISPNHLVSKNSDKVVRRYKYVPQGGNWEDIPARLMTNYSDRSRCHTGIYRRLCYDLPSVVIGNYRKNMLIHPDQDRGLSVREAARIQSFPDWYEFQGSIGFQQQQVGNAVPPLLAKAVFQTILGH